MTDGVHSVGKSDAALSDAVPHGDAVGIDVGGTNIKTAFVSEGQVLETLQCPTPRAGATAVLDEIASLVSRFSVDRVALAIAGPVSPEQGRGEAPLFVPNLPGDWTGVNLPEEILDRTGVTPVLLNDAHAYALGEATLGAARQFDDVVVFTLGTGVGGGVVIGGRLHRGISHRAGELGHMVVEPGGDDCLCGGQGCLETVASADAMARNGGGVSGTDLPAVADRARQGDEIARAAFERAAIGFGLALTATAAVVAPQAAIVGGGAGPGVFDLLEPTAHKVLARRSLLMEAMPLFPAELGANAGSIGAALFVLAKEG